ncbi:hypothetical protein HOLleu_36272 [Holothuria leucospilota]|uniref:Integrase catalytic domain-containing protein n=1 Tax=Holothuria leucospilota TaxID=206669 RepID=A0A9Q0YP21_HOLLE|nr:hypothetical protein HOLleu_36272 [Holothuria leucospilota]
MQIENEIANAEVEVKALEEEGSSVNSGSVKGLKTENRGNVPDHGVTKIKVSAPDAPEGTGVGKKGSTPSQASSLNEPQELYHAISTAVNMPKLEMITFSGDPSEFWGFINNHKASVASKTIDDKTKLAYLIQNCKGKARESIEDCILLKPDEGYRKAIDILRAQFGQPHVICHSLLGKLFNRQQIKPNDGVALSSLARVMRKCQITVEQMKYGANLDSTDTLLKIQRILPIYLQRDWAKKAYEMIGSGKDPKFLNMTEFVERAAKAANSMYGSNIGKAVKEQVQNSKGNSGVRKASAFATSNHKDSKEYRVTKCPCCNGEHNLVSCKEFQEKTQKERFKLVRRLKLCDNCFKPFHRAFYCKLKSGCEVQGCERKHHSLLHWAPQRFVEAKGLDGAGACEEPVSEENRPQATNMSMISSQRVCMKVLPVKVESKGSVVTTWALLDSGSDTSLCERGLVEELGLSGESKAFSLKTVTGNEDAVGIEVSLLVGDMEGKEYIEMPRVLTVDKLPISSENMPTHAELNDQLHKQIKRFWELDHSFAKGEETVGESLEDRRARSMMEATVQLKEGHYEIGMPWKNFPPDLSDNRGMAMSRLMGLKGRFRRDAGLYDQYKVQVRDYLDKGYAREVPESAIKCEGEPVWYLPHHPVINPKKPGKVRVVFDCAAEFEGKSLNSQLLQGPDFTNNLVGVLTRFRQEKIGLVGDIEAMFHQVRVSPKDSDMLRFLWWQDGDILKPIKHYQMVVHLFGATSSPSCTSFALRRTAEDNASDFDEDIVNTVYQNFYVDDCLKSVGTVTEAKRIIPQLCEMLGRGGFRLTKWICNHPEVLADVPNTERAKSVVDCDLDHMPIERTLGVSWDTKTDKFTFKVTPKDVQPTRRGILSATSSLFDPLGFVAPFILRAKIILQDLCAKQIRWDEQVGEQEEQRWREWLLESQQLEGYWPVLREELNESDVSVISNDGPADPELRQNRTCMVVTDDSIRTLLEKYSTWYRLLRGVGWLLRYKKFLKTVGKKEGNIIKGDLSVEELKESETEIVKWVQRESFPSTIRSPGKWKGTAFRKLSPVLVEGVLRVGGRLSRSQLNYDQRHPVILPSDHHVTKLIIEHHHSSVGHMGAGMTWTSLRNHYWVMRGRATVRKIIGKCLACRKRNALPGQQYMADLPVSQVTADKPPFSSVGIDLFGPFLVKRGRSLVKKWGCIFTCLAIRAVHIELVDSMDTDSFINALRRFVSRRGQPERIFSDNGTNFKAADKELREALAGLDENKIRRHLRTKGIEWSFNPPTASHIGGVWERMIRSVRRVMKALLKGQTVTHDVLETTLAEVEAILNSRPLTQLSLDPKDNEPLTPNHLLLMRDSPNLSPGVFDKKDGYGRRRWRQCQYLVNQFWKRWLQEYLPLLQERQKWFKKCRNYEVNDLVLLVEEGTPRGKWTLGRVVQVFPDRKGLVRQVDVRVGHKYFRRPISKLCLLESND